jgi:hypothetical protein
VRIDRSDPADVPDDANTIRHAQSAPDDPDAIGNDRGQAVTGDSPFDATRACSDSALRTERVAAYRTDVDAAYRQYATDHGHVQEEKFECEPITSATRLIEAKDPERHPVGPDDRTKGKGRLAEAADSERGETPRVPDDTNMVACGGSAPDDRDGEYDAVPRAPVLPHDRDLPAGYTSSPALKGDPYHPDSVASRSAANRELYAATSRDRAAALGYDTRIPAQKAPFDSHGQEVFTNGKSYITPDVDSHNVTNGWKMFSRRGVRIGTYDSELNYVKE